MSIARHARPLLVACAAAATFSACGGLHTPFSESGPPLAVRIERGGSQIAPDTKAQDLLYVSQGAGVNVYTYPSGVYVGTLNFLGVGQWAMCVDTRGNVYVPQYYGQNIIEFPHGQFVRPSAIYQFPNSRPYSCAVDPATGKLAVTNYNGGLSNSGSVAIFDPHGGAATVYTDPKIFFYYFCGYDNAGNLFIDGESQFFGFVLAELPKGGTTFTDLTLSNLPKRIPFPGAVQWDGTHLALGDVDRNVVYQVQITGATATIVGSTPLAHGQIVNQFFITPVGGGSDRSASQGLRLIGPAGHGNVVRYWNYPAGGAATKAISVSNGPFGAVISLAVK